jgi:hypothetical protein
VRSATFVIGSRNSKKGCLSNIFQKHPQEYSGYFGKVAGKCEKCQNTLKESKKGIFCNSRQNLRHVLSFCIFAMQFAFCSFFRGSYLGTPAIQFETGSPSSNVIVKVPIDVIQNSLCIDYKGDAQMPRIEEEGLSPPQPPTQQHATLFDARDSSKWKVFTFIMWPLMCNMHPLACSRRGRRVVAPYFCEGAEAMRIAACKVFCLYLDI